MNDTKTRDLWDLVGGLSNPSKMPGFAYGLDARTCIIGRLLAKVSGSVCEKCYALGGMYNFPVVRAAHARRLESISKPYWVAVMTELISRKSKKVPYFRWHDSGDLQSLEHLSKIVEIAKNLPGISFWLPTKQPDFVQTFLRAGNTFPANLTVRVSAPMIGRAPEKISGTVGSSVEDSSRFGLGTSFACMAPKQKGSCMECRACWNFQVEEVTYLEH